ncbi:MAG TPA: 3-methyl-2-oxobutanoate hydroxymethyltransferase [Actinomycetota bacterium]|nr:3-methyl-2-oxobutanoate hydroxymethyltransferase [Actinomycetota bacterium]
MLEPTAATPKEATVSVTVNDVRAFKERGERFAMLTAYDAPSARLVDEAGIPLILVGDTLGMVVLGYETTLPVTMEDMLHHTAAVARGAKNALVIGDMPFMSYQVSVEEGMRNAGRFLKEAGAKAVKLEGGGRVVELVSKMTEAGIPVMGHIGLTPQSVHQFGGFRVQGREQEAAFRMMQDAKDLEAAGVFALVLEAVPASLAQEVTTILEVPTIGIGAGPGCDGQVIVWHDFLGISTGRVPKFVKRYASLDDEIKRAVTQFARDVADGSYPDADHSYE